MSDTTLTARVHYTQTKPKFSSFDLFSCLKIKLGLLLLPPKNLQYVFHDYQNAFAHGFNRKRFRAAFYHML